MVKIRKKSHVYNLWVFMSLDDLIWLQSWLSKGLKNWIDNVTLYRWNLGLITSRNTVWLMWGKHVWLVCQALLSYYAPSWIYQKKILSHNHDLDIDMNTICKSGTGNYDTEYHMNTAQTKMPLTCIMGSAGSIVETKETNGQDVTLPLRLERSANLLCTKKLNRYINKLHV